MLDQYEIDFSRLDYPALTARERDLLKSRAVKRAHAERNDAMRQALLGAWAPLRRAALAVCEAYRARRRRRRTASELYALSDRTLNDIGVTRCEIDALAFGGRA